MKAVFLDTATLGGDVSFDVLKQLPVQWTFFRSTLPHETLERIQDADIVVSNKVVLTGELLRSSHLKLIAVAATGYNNVDVTAAKQLKIPVCNIPGYSTQSVVQLVFTYMLALASSLIPYVEDVRNGKWQRSTQFCFLDYPMVELAGKTLGIVGYGTIGKQVATLGAAFGMNILIAGHPLPLEQLLCEVDFLTLHVPLTPKTQHLICRKELELMKPTAFLINTARGGIVHEQDLAECLKEKRIAGAALDVLTEEPPTGGNPLLGVPNLLLTPHIAWASSESRCRLLSLLKDNIQAFLEGSPQNLIPK
jgi:glycerate dehydrogenase